ncbi:hypothetical protein LSAT2_032249, partial [Lamellibrachia satsuma]
MDEDQTDETIKQLCQVATRDHYDGFPNNTPLLERAPTADLLRTDAEGNVFFVQTPQRCTPKSLCEKLTRLAVNKKKHVPKQRQPPCNKHPVVKAITGTIVNKSGRDLAVRTITEDIRLRSARFSGNVTCTRIPRQVSCTDVTPDETGRTQSERRQIYFSHHYHDSTHGTILSRLDASNTMRRLKRLKIKEKKSSELDVAFVGGQISEDGVSLGRSVNVELSECGVRQAATRWRWVTCMVRVLIHLMLTMGELSVARTQRSAVEWQWHSLYTVSETTQLTLNPLLYARRRTRCRVPRWAKSVLSKSPQSRTDAECQRLHAMLRGHKSFDKFTQQIQLAMCRAFTLQCTHSQRIILREGHVGQNFYVIFSGSVFINIDDVSDGKKEVALLCDVRRTATVTCREACELLVVDKDVFSLVCPRIFDKELDERVNFIRPVLMEVDLFSWGGSVLMAV